MKQDDGHIPNTVEKQIFETLVKIQQRDSSIYDSNKHFFTEPADADAGAAKQSTKASKPMMLKDVIAQQVWSKWHSLLALLYCLCCKYCLFAVTYRVWPGLLTLLCMVSLLGCLIYISVNSDLHGELVE